MLIRFPLALFQKLAASGIIYSISASFLSREDFDMRLFGFVFASNILLENLLGSRVVTYLPRPDILISTFSVFISQLVFFNKPLGCQVFCFQSLCLSY